ncbi:HEAT repeat domain-containing protein [Candidatus Desantisbacteria bacterium]|nr:HEAT repeat domain-containing protein [Candidatus Desantisbacteria bacterium]
MRFIFLAIVLLFVATYSYGDETASSPTININQPTAQSISQIISNLKDNDETIRIQAAETAGELSVGDCPSIISALIHALNDPKWRVKKNAILAL